MKEIGNTLYNEARKVLKPRKVFEMLETAGVAAAIESSSGKIYTGVCVDGACTLGICVERNAVFHMLTCGDDSVKRVATVNWDGKVLPPCGACRELITQLMPKSYRNVEIMTDYEKGEVTTLGELTPRWWI